mgnify:CR=1 FL=1
MAMYLTIEHHHTEIQTVDQLLEFAEIAGAASPSFSVMTGGCMSLPLQIVFNVNDDTRSVDVPDISARTLHHITDACRDLGIAARADYHQYSDATHGQTSTPLGFSGTIHTFDVGFREPHTRRSTYKHPPPKKRGFRAGAAET